VNEVEGIDYFFYSNEKFDSAISRGEFLEWAEFAGNRYGTLAAPVNAALAEGRNVLLEIEIAGAKQVKAHMPEAHLIFLEPPSWEELVSRLEGRGTDSPERRAARLALAQEELAAASFFDTVVVNEQVDEVVSTLIRLATL
jgi:guanylate kinase